MSLEKLLKYEKEAVGDGIYSPNSVMHGWPRYGIAAPRKEAQAKNNYERLTDFVEFLFEHSEHCDHISQREAWHEFELYELKESLKSNPL